MEDPNRGAVVTPRNRSDVCDQIGRAVGTAWQRRSGTRPANVETEYDGDVIRCTIEQGTESAEESTDEAPAAANPNAPEVGGYDQEAKAAVARLTGRTVVGFVVKKVKTGDAATNTFILDPIRRRY